MNIGSVKDIGSLLAYFREYAGWPLEVESFEDIAEHLYDYSADDLGLKPEECAKIRSLKQLPSLEEGQSWGIFAVEFATPRLAVTALRKILAHLVPTRRNASDHAVWNARDLLFLCFWGEGPDRTACVAYFQEQDRGLARIRCTYCAPARESGLALSKFGSQLQKFRWSESEHWREAFDSAYGEVIKTSAELAQSLAEVACRIKNGIVDALAVESDRGFVHRLCDKVRRELVHTMTADEFADMYAQTIVYGLFSARCMDDTPDDFTAAESVELIPNTNPFLKGLMRECLQGESRQGFGFDELGVGDVVELLARVRNARTIASHFDRMTGGGREDPVIHFYEEFLAAYDKAQKVQRGVFYTPKPVVRFTVRAVDALLKETFGLADGLASDEKVTVKKEVRDPRSRKERTVKRDVSVPRVQVLDPATGTGTYVMETILLVYETFKAKHKGLSEGDFHAAWNDYVDRNVLPRLNAFELMMAPYAVAHMKLAMVLKDTGYEFKSDRRLRVFLTNSLEEAGSTDKQMTFWDDPLAAESVAANEAKSNEQINVVIGNPPYSVSSANKGEWIQALIADYKKDLRERKINLDDDYIKFVRLGQHYIERNGQGILAYISNNSFLDGITHRQMRKTLLEAFDEIYILNLHGNARKKETCPDGSKDENVFDIMQGVSINIFVKHGNSFHVEAQNGRGTRPACPQGDGSTAANRAPKSQSSLARVFYADVYGLREAKYDFLGDHALNTVDWQTLDLCEPYYFFVPKDFSLEEEYKKGFGVTELLSTYNSGIQTKRDDLTISFDESRVNAIISDFTTKANDELRTKYHLKADGRDWTLAGAISDLKNNKPRVVRYLYRPFDVRYTAYTGKSRGFIGYPRDSVMSSVRGDNPMLLTVRLQTTFAFQHAYVATDISDLNSVSMQTGEQSYVFPLYLYSESMGRATRRVNFDEAIYEKICAAAGIAFDPKDLQTSAAADEPPTTPQLVFDYVYAVLHSGKYRKKYVEFLKIDFPRIPYPRDGEEFRTMAAFGARLRRIHCMEDFDEAADVAFVSDGGPEVAKVAWADGAVSVNGASRFTNVAKEDWEFCIGGYQPLQKWLKDRKGARLSSADVSHYRRIVRAIRSTREVMSEIDAFYTPGEA